MSAGLSNLSTTSIGLADFDGGNQTLSNGTICIQPCFNGSRNDDPVSDTESLVLVVLRYANYILLPVVLILGLTGNCLTVMVMKTRRYSHMTSRLFLTALALSDTMLLLTQPFNKMFVINLIGRDLRALTDTGCKTFFVLFKTAKMTSSWFLVFLCMERFVAVWFPLRAKFIFTKTLGYIGIAIVYVIQCTYNSVWSYASQISEDNVCHPDTYDRNNPEEVERFGRMVIIGCTMYSILPMICMIILTPLIIIKLYRHTKKRRDMTSKMQKRQDDSRRTTIMLIGVVIAYVLLITPVTTLHLGAFALRLNAFGKNDIGFLVFRDVSQILEQINYAINFFLYVLASSTFRKGLKETLNFGKFKILSREKSSTSGSSSTGSTSFQKSKKSLISGGETNRIFQVEKD